MARRQAPQQDCDDAGYKDAVECAGATDGGDWRAKPRDLVEVQEISADQSTKGSGDIRERADILRSRRSAMIAVAIAGTKIGIAMPRPGTGVARE